MIKMEGVQENQGKQGINLEQAMNALIDYEWNRPKNKPGISKLTSRIQHIIRLIKESSDFYRSTKTTYFTPQNFAREIHFLEKVMEESHTFSQRELLRKRIVGLYITAYGGEVIKEEENKWFERMLEYAREGRRDGIKTAIENIKALRYLEGRNFPEEEDKKTLEEIWDVYKEVGIPYIVNRRIEMAKRELRKA